MIKIENKPNLRKKEQLTDNHNAFINAESVFVYKDKKGSSFESFAYKVSKEEYQSMLDNFNRTLRPGESKRYFVKEYTIKKVYYLKTVD